MTQAYRCRKNLVAEKLFLIIDPSSDAAQEKEMSYLWLKQYLESQKQQPSAKVGSSGMTRSEDLAAGIYHSMAVMLDEVQSGEKGAETRREELNNEICDRLEEQTALISGLHDLVPALESTLHVLYTAHEVGRTMVNFCLYLSKQDKGSVEQQKDANKKIGELARQLLQLVVDKCAVVKKGLDEGGWIDKVLERTLPEGQDGVDGAVVRALRKVLDENFMEEWAGEVVESWRDSAVGFSYLKGPTKS